MEVSQVSAQVFIGRVNKSKLELKSNSSEIFPVNWKFISFFTLKVRFKDLNLNFICLSWSRIRDKLTKFRFQLKFAFIMYGPISFKKTPNCIQGQIYHIAHLESSITEVSRLKV